MSSNAPNIMQRTYRMSSDGGATQAPRHVYFDPREQNFGTDKLHKAIQSNNKNIQNARRTTTERDKEANMAAE